MRELERTIMLNILDQHWREHLYEMDYLREGIGLRAMGQRDPLTEWQREGYDMFSQMMKSVAQDFVRYVMHAEVTMEAPPEPEPAKVTNVAYTSSDNLEPLSPSEMPAADGGATGDTGRAVRTAERLAGESRVPQQQTPVVRTESERVGRNDPCPCGSGKKFKLCHGRTPAGSTTNN
jgi:preprotein translocase subunit SecA